MRLCTVIFISAIAILFVRGKPSFFIENDVKILQNDALYSSENQTVRKMLFYRITGTIPEGIITDETMRGLKESGQYLLRALENMRPEIFVKNGLIRTKLQ